MADSWADSEARLADLWETQTSFRLFALYRSYVPGGSWIGTAGAVTDAAALASTVLAVPPNALVDIVLQGGTRTIVDIAADLSTPFEREPPRERLHVSRGQFDGPCSQLAEAGAPLKMDREHAWRDFAAMRAHYDDALAGLAAELVAALPPLGAG